MLFLSLKVCLWNSFWAVLPLPTEGRQRGCGLPSDLSWSLNSHRSDSCLFVNGLDAFTAWWHYREGAQHFKFNFLSVYVWLTVPSSPATSFRRSSLMFILFSAISSTRSKLYFFQKWAHFLVLCATRFLPCCWNRSAHIFFFDDGSGSL